MASFHKDIFSVLCISMVDKKKGVINEVTKYDNDSTHLREQKKSCVQRFAKGFYNIE